MTKPSYEELRIAKHSGSPNSADSASDSTSDQAATEIRTEPKFKVGQIVILANLKKQPPFRILAMQWSMGSWFYAWNRKNFAAEHMIRALNETETAAEN